MLVNYVRRGLSGLAMSATAVSMLASSADAMEIRAGGYYHGLRVAAPHAREDTELDFNAEVLFDSPVWLSWLASPRPQIGTTISKHGTSLIYTDLNWTVNLTDAVYFDFGFGGAIHDGRLDGSSVNNDENRYGCRVNFHENISIGYRFTEDVALMATIEHMSNASLCSYNEGLTNVGVRLGYSF